MGICLPPNAPSIGNNKGEQQQQRGHKGAKGNSIIETQVGHQYHSSPDRCETDGNPVTYIIVMDFQRRYGMGATLARSTGARNKLTVMFRGKLPKSLYNPSSSPENPLSGDGVSISEKEGFSTLSWVMSSLKPIRLNRRREFITLGPV